MHVLPPRKAKHKGGGGQELTGESRTFTFHYPRLIHLLQILIELVPRISSIKERYDFQNSKKEGEKAPETENHLQPFLGSDRSRRHFVLVLKVEA